MMECMSGGYLTLTLDVAHTGVWKASGARRMYLTW